MSRAQPRRRRVTAADLMRCRMRTRKCRRLAATGGVQIVQQCLEHPRLTCTRWAGLPTACPVWCLWVDGRPVATLAAAAEALNHPANEVQHG